jgi:hypothetical protein
VQVKLIFEKGLTHTTNGFIRNRPILKHKILPDISDSIFTHILVFGAHMMRNTPYEQLVQQNSFSVVTQFRSLNTVISSKNSQYDESTNFIQTAV